MTTVKSLAPNGISGTIIDVECRISQGLPALQIVGCATRSVDEARERVRAACAVSGFKLPPQRIVVNLAPADLPKVGSSFDLAIAASLLIATHPNYSLDQQSLLLGELGLDGSLRPIRGLVAALLAGRQAGFKTFYIPAEQARLADIIPSITLVPISTLAELQCDMAGSSLLPRLPTSGLPPRSALQPAAVPDLADITGQDHAKRALEIAAAGGHSLLLTGPPGTGKTILARCLSSLLPSLDQTSLLEVNQLHSLVLRQAKLVHQPPCRAPHHSASLMALIGGGQPIRPGEISLSHRGVLILDELPEFSRQSIEALRQPLEDQQITLSRGQASVSFPADFILVATANLCPCGHYGSRQTCRCPASAIERYRQKLSGPLLDRLDMWVEVSSVDHPNLLADGSTTSSRTVRQRVVLARQRQRDRQGPAVNARLDNRAIKRGVKLRTDAKQLLDQAAPRLNLSARGYLKAVKVARTIADLAGSPAIEAAHIAEALQYRQRQNP